jgi:hypothetical protein
MQSVEDSLLPIPSIVIAQVVDIGLPHHRDMLFYFAERVKIIVAPRIANEDNHESPVLARPNNSQLEEQERDPNKNG